MESSFQWCVALDLDTGRPCTAWTGGLPDLLRGVRPDGWLPLCEKHQDGYVEFLRRAERIGRWEARSHQQVVYIAKQRDYVKVGTSSRLDERLRTLAREGSGRPEDLPLGPLTLLATIRGGFDDEAQAHERIRAFRVAGEWFRDGPELRLDLAYWLGEYRAAHDLTAEEQRIEPAFWEFGEIDALLAGRRGSTWYQDCLTRAG